MSKIIIILAILFGLFIFGCIKDDSLPPNKLNDVLTSAIEKKDFSLCSSSGLDKIDERKCYYLYAGETGNSEVCKKVEINSSDASYSIGGCYLQIAKKTSDESICNEIEQNDGGATVQIKNLCYYELAIAKKDISLCDRMTDDYQPYCPPCPEGAMCIACQSTATKDACKEITNRNT
ncbi:MAG: hypothetical protein Q7S22_01340 [Candidatus Micrarchaeota archaeon]|nr:hypothetical protein [Candidatus Micrarchaeota archaeon]